MDTIMKKILSLIALGTAFAFAVSCDLSEYNPNEPGYEKVFSSATNVQYVINSFYGGFGSVTNAYSKDAATDYFPAQALSARFQKGYSATSTDKWGEWDDVYQYNYVLTQLNSSAASALSAAEKEDFIAQVRLFRARKYYNMVMQYGDLPWFDRVINPVETDYEHKDRESRDVVMKHILEDFDYAIEHITATSPDATCVSKEVALFLKMRACLYEASFRKYNNVTASAKGEAFTNYTVDQLYELAADAAKQIIDGGKYSLIPNYRDLFLSDKLQTKEVILGAQTASNILGSQNHYFVYTKQTDPKTLTRTFVNTFLMKDGTPYTDKAGYATETWKEEFANRDPRLELTVRYPGYKFAGATAVPDFGASFLGYQIRKFCYDNYAETNGADPDENDKHNSNSTPIFRYAEVLLSYAEAKAELGQMDNAVWAQTVGAIRQRAGITGSSLTAVPSTVDSYLKTNYYPDVTSAAIMEIRRERGVELCMEGVRENDLIRWGCGKLLSTAPWDGINIDAVNTALDLDGNGTSDVCFYTDASKKVSGITNIAVDGSIGLTVADNGGKKQLRYDVDPDLRYWAPDNHLILDALPSQEIAAYSKLGYTLTQNPGY